MIIYNERFPEKVKRLKEKNRIESLILKIASEASSEYTFPEERKKTIIEMSEILEQIKEDLSCESVGKKYLSEIIKEENISFDSNSLIISPVGSGKTTLIKEVLIKEDNSNKLLLVSTSFLKDTLNNSDKVLKSNINIKIMTYHEFGLRISNNNKFVENINQIFCDEIHSLPEYRNYNGTSDNLSYALEHAIKYLFNKHEGKEIYYFTATDSALKKIKEKRKGLMEDIATYDFRERKDIKQYIEISKVYMNHMDQIQDLMRKNYKRLNHFKYKGIGFAKTISSLKKLEEILLSEGFSPLVLWSKSNPDYKLNEEQLRARSQIMLTGIIPEGYDFLLVNSSMREGWDLIDKDVKIAIMNTTDETDIIQARGRVRKDLDLIIYKNSEDKSSIKNTEIIDRYIGKILDKSEKDKLCLELDMRNKNNHILKWNTLKKLLVEEGYEIVESRPNINGKRTNVSMIKRKGG